MNPETWTAWAFGFLGGAAIINSIWMLATTPKKRSIRRSFGTFSLQNQSTVIEKSQTTNLESGDLK